MADRRAARDLLVGAAALRTAVLAGVGIAALDGVWSLPLLYLAVLAFRIGEVVGDTTSQTLVPQLVSTERPGTANGELIAAQATLTNVAGAPLAGLLVGVGAAVALLGPAALYLAAALVFPSLPERYRPATRPATTLRHDVAEGVRVLWRSPALRALAALGTLVNLASSASLVVNVVSVSSRQRAVPRALLGRVNATFRPMAAGMMPLGALLGGFVTDASGLRTLFAAAVVLQLVALVACQGPLRDADLRATPTV